MDQFLWYACYGSNLLYERFRCYIEGGECKYNGVGYRGCRDKTLPGPGSIRAAVLPYALYFGNHSKSWGGGGVAFLDKDKPSVTLGKMYLITEEQFVDVYMQENCGPEWPRGVPEGDLEALQEYCRCHSKWYHEVLEFGEFEGHPVKTFTNGNRLAENPPSEPYLEVIRLGMEEMLKDKNVFKSPVAILRPRPALSRKAPETGRS